MTPQERDLILGLFQRLKAADSDARDTEALALINRLVAQQPAAPYLLVQTALVQEHALKGAEARIAELERELEAARTAAPERPASRASFLGGLIGPWGARPADPSPRTAAPQPPPQSAMTAPMAGPAGYGPAYGYNGGGFLQQALVTAAGVAGGALLFDGIRSMLWHSGGPFGGMIGPGYGYGPGMSETVINNYYDGSPAGGEPHHHNADGVTPDPGGHDPHVTNADYHPDGNLDNQGIDGGGLGEASDPLADSGGFADSGDWGGGDMGGGGDWT